MNPHAFRHMHLKHACLPFHHSRTKIFWARYFFPSLEAGAAGAAGAGEAGFTPGAAAGVPGALGEGDGEVTGTLLRTSTGLFAASRTFVIEKLPTKKIVAKIAVVFVRKLPAPRLPKMLWLDPPNVIAPAPSPFPGCNKTTQTSRKQRKINNTDTKSIMFT